LSETGLTQYIAHRWQIVARLFIEFVAAATSATNSATTQRRGA